jgi:hypothetical protein
MAIFKILKEGLAYAARLSVHGSGSNGSWRLSLWSTYSRGRGRRVKKFTKKPKRSIEEGKARGSLTLKGFEKKVEADGRKYVVKVIDGSAEFDEGRGGRKLLRIKITAEVGRVKGGHTIVDRVVREYTITFGRYGRDNAAMGFATARANAPGGREADAERYSALIKALTGREPGVYRKSDGKILIECYEGHLEGFRRFAELADDIEKWLEETARRA